MSQGPRVDTPGVLLFGYELTRREGTLKKGFKIFLIMTGVLVLLLGIGIGLLCIPGIQKRVVLSLLRKEAPSANLRSVRLGIQGVRIYGLEMVVDGTVVRLDSGRFKVPVLPLMFKRELDFNKVDLNGLEIDFRQNRGGPPFGGVLKPLDLGGPLTVDELDITGRFLFHEKVSMELDVHGAVGLDTQTSLPTEGRLYVKDKVFKFEGGIDVAGNAVGRIISLQVNVDSELTDGVRILVSADAVLEDDKEAYTLVSSLSSGSKTRELFLGNGSYQLGTRRTEFELKGRADRNQLLEFAPKLDDRIPEGLLVDVDIQGGSHADSWRLETGQVVTSMDGIRMALRILKPFIIDFERGMLDGLKPGVRAAGLNVSIPLAKVLPGLSVAGPALQADMFMESMDEGFAIHADAPLVWSGLDWTRKDGKVFRFDLSADPEINWRGDRIKGEIKNLQLKTRNSKMLSGKFVFERQAGDQPWKGEAVGNVRMEDVERILLEGKGSFFRPTEQGDFKLAGAYDGSVATLEECTLKIGGVHPLLHAQLPQALRIGRDANGKFSFEKGGTLLELETRDLDLGRFGALHPKMALQVAPVSGRWSLNAGHDGIFELKAKEPLVLEDVSFGWDGTGYVFGEQLRGDLVLRFEEDGIAFNVDDLLLGGVGDPLVTGDFAYASQGANEDWGGTFEVQLPRASRTILFKGAKGAFTAGTAMLKLDGSDSDSGVKLDMKLQGAVLKDRPDSPINAEVGLTWLQDDPEEKTFQARFNLEDGMRESMGGLTAWTNNRFIFNATGLHLDHVLFAAETYQAYAVPTTGAANRPLPVLSMNVSVEKFHATEGRPVGDIRASVVSGREKVELNSVSATFGDRGRVQGNLKFARGLAAGNPNLVSNIGFEDIEMADFFKEPGLGKRAPLEGKVTKGRVDFNARGENLDQLLESADIKLEVSARDGSFRFHKLEEKLEEIGKLAKTTGKVSEGAGKLGGALTRNLPVPDLVPDLFEVAGQSGKTVANAVGGSTVLLSQLLNFPGMRQALTRIKFDAAEIKAARTSNGSASISNFRMQGPSVFVFANGQLESRSLDQVLDAPMRLNLYIGVKGFLLGKFLSGPGQLDPENKLEGGYMVFKSYPVIIGGTLRDPKLDLLWDVLFPFLKPQFIEKSVRELNPRNLIPLPF